MLAAAGVVAMLITWSAVANTPLVPAQVAFALSGGAGGLALFGTGLVLLEIQHRRYAAAESRRELVTLSAEIAAIAELIALRRMSEHAPSRRRVLRARKPRT